MNFHGSGGVWFWVRQHEWHHHSEENLEASLMLWLLIFSCGHNPWIMRGIRKQVNTTWSSPSSFPYAFQPLLPVYALHVSHINGRKVCTHSFCIKGYQKRLSAPSSTVLAFHWGRLNCMDMGSMSLEIVALRLFQRLYIICTLKGLKQIPPSKSFWSYA